MQKKNLSVLLTGVMATTSYQNLHLGAHLNSPLHPGGTLQVLKHWGAAVLRMHSLSAPAFLPDAKTEPTSFQCQTSDLQCLLHHVKTTQLHHVIPLQLHISETEPVADSSTVPVLGLPRYYLNSSAGHQQSENCTDSGLPFPNEIKTTGFLNDSKSLA